MNYLQKYFNEIFESMLEDSLERGLISHAEEFESYIKNQEDISNYYVMDKAVIARWFEIFYEDLTKVYESAKVEYCEGVDSDNIGDIVGIPRPLATFSEVGVKFTTTETSEINIPEGVIIATVDGNIVYKTLEPIYIAEDSLETIVQCRSLEPGLSSKVFENTLTNIVTNLEYDLECTNPESSSGGFEAYSDDEYRYLLLNWTKIHLKGSLEAFENYFANAEGVNGYKLVPNWNGTGTIKIIVDPGTSYQLNQIYQDLQGIITQATEDIAMFAPVRKPIDIYATVNVDIDQINPYSSSEKEDIKSRIIQAIKVFIDEGYRSDGAWYTGLDIGEDFIPHKLQVFLDEEIPELKNINFTYPTNFIPITDEEKGVSNNIHIEMI